MKRSLTLVLLLALPCLAAKPPAVSPEKLLAEVIESPGEYNQMCNMRGWMDPPVVLPVYDFVLPRHFHLSAAVLERLRKQRAEMIPAMAKMIASIQPDVPVENDAPAKDPAKPLQFSDIASHSGVSPKQLSGLLLEMAAGLNAIEVLPELLDLEQRLENALAQAEKDESVPLPSVDFDANLWLYKSPQPSPRRLELMKDRIVQGELLGIMLKLLRNQRFQPLLDSDFEQAYVTAIKKRAAEEDLRDIKTEADAQKKKLVLSGNWMGFDPIYHVPLAVFSPTPTVPYTPEAREKARGLVSSFIATVPRTSWKTSAP